MGPRKEIVICLGSSCFARGNKMVLRDIQAFIRNNDLTEKVNFHGDHCFDTCTEGPCLKIGSRHYAGVNTDNINSILKDALSDLTGQ